MESGAEMRYTVLVDAQRRVVRLPEALAERLGVEAADTQLDWQSLVVEDASKFLPAEAGEVVERSGYLKHASGEIEEVEFACERLALPHDLVCIEISIAKVEAPSVEPVDKEALDFLTTVSHELRVALNGVIGFTNVLSGTQMDADQHAILDKLQSCNHMLKGLINDILEYSRVATSKINFHAETVNVDHFVHEVVGLFRERARKKGLELRLNVGEDANFLALLPRMRVTQVLSNLIANAIKFTSNGWVSVSVSCQNETLCIGVQDTGSGVGKEQGDAIFRPFFQLGEPSRTPEGTGLGLAISKELVTKMGGSLKLLHPKEGGSLFEISLPLRPSSESAEPASFASPNAEVAEVEIKPERRDESKRVLVVEDNQLNADILGHFLQDYGAKFDRVDNGRSAVETYQDGKYDLILMDVMLPEMNGYEATEKILSLTRLQPPVPIIGVTAKVFRRDQVRCIEAGMVEVVHKPVDFKQLRSVLDRYLYSDGNSEFATLDSSESEVVEEDSFMAVNPLAEEASEPKRSNNVDFSVLEAYIDRMKTSDTNRREIVATAIGIVDAEVASLLDSIGGGNRKDVGMRAHSLKGALALLGARNILDLAKGLELVASDGRAPLKGEHWKLLIEGAYSEFKEELELYMDSSSFV
ncbi:sensor histidine kinase [Pelagicoccus mobilis]|uniref:histidine kinase n=1 Tax=Pelagicoccus mobilis TaxID=415221 RepID=A0A934VND0_9BACT|nr:sensor histidine kinase [Pelagicoccus mobilis]MBK1879801.1 response regulator [Pelagicoccus mobilis]